MKATDKEVIGVMVSGGEKLCDYALQKWIAGDYGGGDMRIEYIDRWNNIRSRIREIANAIPVT